MKKLKIWAGRIIFIAIMLFIIAAFILYQQGYYDISFIKRETEPSNDNIEETTVTSTEETIPIPPQSESDNNEQETEDIPVTQIVNVSDYKQLLSKIENSRTYLNSGWKITDNIYNRNINKIVSFNIPLDLDSGYSHRNEFVKTQVFNESRGVYEAIDKVKKLPHLRSYMGYLLINNKDGTTSLYNPIKNIISRNLTDLQPAYIRDIYGQPVFSYGEIYHTVNENNHLQPIANDTVITEGIIGNNPSYYGAANSGLYLYYNERVVSNLVNAAQVNAAISRGEYIEPIYVDQKIKTYGYKNENGVIVIPAKYQYAFNFSDNGLAVVADRKRAISVINTYGNTVITVQNNTLRLPELSNRIIYDGYYLPDDFSMNQRGMLYFDHGLLRVRRIITEYNNLNSILLETDILIKPDGQIYDLPAGYEIVYYSDGVAVLKKGIYYGCFSHTGKWIVQPIYTYAGMFNEGLAVIGAKDGKKGVIDTNGNTVLPFVFDEISDISGGIITAFEKQNGWSVYFKISR